MIIELIVGVFVVSILLVFWIVPGASLDWFVRKYYKQLGYESAYAASKRYEDVIVFPLINAIAFGFAFFTVFPLSKQLLLTFFPVLLFSILILLGGYFF